MLSKLTSPFCASLSKTRARDLTSSVEEGQQYLWGWGQGPRQSLETPRTGIRSLQSFQSSPTHICMLLITTVLGLCLVRDYYIHMEIASQCCHWGSEGEMTFPRSQSREQGQGWDSHLLLSLYDVASSKITPRKAIPTPHYSRVLS